MDNSQKKEKPVDQHNWDEVSEGEEEEKPQPKEERHVEMRKELIVPTRHEEPKKVYLKTKTGDIVINTMERYVEPVKMVKETRGDVSKIVVINL